MFIIRYATTKYFLMLLIYHFHPVLINYLLFTSALTLTICIACENSQDMLLSCNPRMTKNREAFLSVKIDEFGEERDR